MYVTWQSVITAGAVLAAIIAIATFLIKVYNLVKLSKDNEKEIESIKEEQGLLTYGILACLKGLREQGCDGEVTAAIDKIEKHLNEKAHA